MLNQKNEKPMNCSNCKAQLTCGCQKRVAADGKACCSTCVNKYNESLKNKPVNETVEKPKTSEAAVKPASAPTTESIAPVVFKIKASMHNKP